MNDLDFFIMFFLIVIVLPTAIFFIIICFINDSGTLDQDKCDHDWHLVGRTKDKRRIMYCPKCKLEEWISEVKWREIQIDKKYEEKNNETIKDLGEIK